MKTRLPKLCRNKTRDVAFVYRDSKKIYLGRWNAPETIAAYRRYIADLVADRLPVVAQDASASSSVTVAELTAAFFEDRAEYYVKNGKQTGQLDRFRAALEFPLRYFPATPVDDFGPKKLLFCRDEMEKSGRFARSYINTLVNCVRTVFKFGVGRELVKPETLVALQTVRRLSAASRAPAKSSQSNRFPATTLTRRFHFYPDKSRQWFGFNV